MSTLPKHEYTLRLGSIAPDFEAETTAGRIKFHEWLGDSWVGASNLAVLSNLLSHLQGILFSHPGGMYGTPTAAFLIFIPPDFTPVCTTELGEVARRSEDFAKRNVKVIGISASNLDDHKKWIKDINDFGREVGPTDVQFPIVRCQLNYAIMPCRTPLKIADADRRVSYIYDMLDYQDATNKDLKGLPFTVRNRTLYSGAMMTRPHARFELFSSLIQRK